MHYLYAYCIEAGCKVYQSTHVDCTYRDLRAVPSNLPSSTTHLDLSDNHIKRLTQRSFKNLHSLEELTMSIDQDLHIDSDTFVGLHRLRRLIFPRDTGSWVTFGKGTFKHLSSLQELELQIRTFSPDNMFSNLINLSRLTINITPMDVRNPHSVDLPLSLFRGLTNLEELKLVDPLGSFLASLSNESFKDLVKLKSIHISSDHRVFSIVEKLEALKNIEKIDIKSRETVEVSKLNITFPQFLRLKTVKFHVFLDNQSPIFVLSKKCSQNLVAQMEWDIAGHQAGSPYRLWPGNVSELDLHTKHRTKTDRQSFDCILNGLQNVTINFLSIYHVLEKNKEHNLTDATFKSLAGSNIKIMSMTETLGIIAPDTFMWLPQLNTLYMNDCDLSDNAFVSLNGPSTLTTLFLRGNKFQNFKKLMSALAKLNNLRIIDVSYNVFTGKIPAYAFRKHQSLTSINLSGNKFKAIDSKSFSFLSNLQYLDLSRNNIDMVLNGEFHALKVLNELKPMTNSLLYQGDTEISERPLKYLTRLTSLKLSSLELNILDLADTPQLERLHIYDTSEMYVNDVLFPEDLLLEHLTDLKVENAEFVDLDKKQIVLNTEVINLKPRHFLKVLKLSHNNFNELNFTSLNAFRSLIELSVPNNKLSIIHGVPDKLNKLETLDLSGNSIAVLSSEMVTLLPSLKLLKIHKNAFDCSCKMKPFKDWLRKDEKVFVHSSSISSHRSLCSLPPAKYNVPIDLVELGLECNLVFLISLPLTCFVVLMVIIVTLVWRFHWHLRFICFLIKLRLGGYQLQINEEQPINKRYDAFVVYNQHDSDWVIHELVPNLENIDPPNFKLCIHERDFLPGNDIFKTMLILSPDFAASEWCYFEMRMAQSCLFEEKRDIIVMISLKRIPDDGMPRILRNILLTKSYLEWPDNEMGRRLFWEKLKVALRSESRVNRVANF
ncbi:toll-like receptor 4 [Ptychodera flava]|uniref:toll-like receptor 4 n=1 Tax=Ptychodera flava TaxID=63121 RepID=UPI00396A6034